LKGSVVCSSEEVESSSSISNDNDDFLGKAGTEGIDWAGLEVRLEAILFVD
jgi:hypothetical protein